MPNSFPRCRKALPGFVSCNRAPILIRLQKTLIRSGAVRIRVISDIELVPKGQVQLRAQRLR
jgi:hypothetical protein